MRHSYWHTCGEGSDRLDRNVFVFTAALGALLNSSFGIDFVLEGADGTLGPQAKLTRFAATASDLVANPCEEDSREKDKKRRKHQPWQGHANHDAGLWMPAPNWKFTNPQASGMFSAGAKRRDLRTWRAWRSRSALPEERDGRMWATVPSERMPTKNEAESSESASVFWGGRISRGGSGRRSASSGDAVRLFES